MYNEATRGVYYLRIREKTTRNDLQRRFLAQHIVAKMFRNVATLFQHCNAVLRKKSSLQLIVPCNIILKVPNVIVAETKLSNDKKFYHFAIGRGFNLLQYK